MQFSGTRSGRSSPLPPAQEVQFPKGFLDKTQAEGREALPPPSIGRPLFQIRSFSVIGGNQWENLKQKPQLLTLSSQLLYELCWEHWYMPVYAILTNFSAVGHMLYPAVRHSHRNLIKVREFLFPYYCNLRVALPLPWSWKIGCDCAHSKEETLVSMHCGPCSTLSPVSGIL